MEEDKKNQQPKPAGGMGRHQQIGMPTDKPADFKGSIKKLWKYLKPYSLGLFAVLLFAIASTIFTILSPKLLGEITNQVVDDYISVTAYNQVQSNIPEGVFLPEGTTLEEFVSTLPPEMTEQLPTDQLEQYMDLDITSRPSFDFYRIGQLALVVLAIYLLSALFRYVQGWIMAGISQKVTFTLRRMISEKLNVLPLKYYDDNSYGDILSRITNDIDTVSQSLGQGLSQMIISLTTIVGIVIMMLTISWEMTIIAFLVLPVSMVIISLVVKSSQKYFKQQQDSLGKINGHVEEMYSGHSIVKAYNGEQASIDEFQGINNDLYASGWKSQFFSGLMMPIMRFVGNLGYVAVAVVGGWLAIEGRIKIGDIQAFIQYLQQFTQPIVQASQTITTLQSTAAAAERVFEILESDEQVNESANPVELKNVRGEIEFKNVNFRYKEDEPLITNFDLQVKPGQRVAIVGPTGAGKTTIVNLLMRFYEIDSGVITIDGVDTRELRRSDLRRLFGMVLQDTWLFQGTIRENLTYGNPDVSDEELFRITKAARVDHIIKSLPGGYDMVLDESAENLSVGEKQLMTIARAMVTNPPMLILDEATSSVDTRTETLIQEAMDELMEGRTSFVIAHRLSTIRDADLIIVMNNGEIVEQGNHESLLGAGGFYSELYNSQFEASS